MRFWMVCVRKERKWKLWPGCQQSTAVTRSPAEHSVISCTFTWHCTSTASPTSSSGAAVSRSSTKHCSYWVTFQWATAAFGNWSNWKLCSSSSTATQWVCPALCAFCPSLVSVFFSIIDNSGLFKFIRCSVDLSAGWHCVLPALWAHKLLCASFYAPLWISILPFFSYIYISDAL